MCLNSTQKVRHFQDNTDKNVDNDELVSYTTLVVGDQETELKYFNSVSFAL